VKSAVLEFQRDRVKGPEAETAGAASIDILQMLADLREDLQCIEKAITAVERLAIARMGEGAGESPKAVSRKKGAHGCAPKREGRVLVLRRPSDARASAPLILSGF